MSTFTSLKYVHHVLCPEVGPQIDDISTTLDNNKVTETCSRSPCIFFARVLCIVLCIELYCIRPSRSRAELPASGCKVCLYFECQSWIKETARRCPMCGQPKDHADGSGGGGRAHALGQDAHGRAHRHTPHAHGEDEPDAAEELSEVERQRHGVTKNRLRSLGKLWSSAAR